MDANRPHLGASTGVARARHRRLLGLLGAALLVAASACGDDGDAPSATVGATSTVVASDGTTGSTSGSDPTASEEVDTEVPPEWPADLALPTAVDPTGAPIEGSLALTNEPVPGDVVQFDFAQADQTSMQSAFTGVARWAETSFAADPAGNECLADQASAAALNGGQWGCLGILEDGRSIQVSTAYVDREGVPNAALALTVLIKRA